MITLGEKLRELRLEHKFPLRKVALLLDVDVAILSKMERGERKLTKAIVQKLAKIYKYNIDELMVLYLSEKILYEIGDEKMALKALQVAEEKVEYVAFKKINKKDLLKKIIAGIKRFPQVKKAWIYGSFARGDDGPKSDIDIAFLTTGKFSYFDLAEIQYILEGIINRKVDVGFIDSFKPYIFENIKSELKLIYEK